MRRGAPLLDTRSERSRAAILGAFITLIFRDGFERLSVGAIVAEAGVARSTFYEHFSGKEDVLQASMSHFFNVMAGCVASDQQPPELIRVIEHFWGNRRMADAVFTGHPRLILVRSLSELIERRLRAAGEGGKPLVPYELSSIQIAEAQIALVENWLRGRAYCQAEDMAAALHRSSRAFAISVR